MPASIRPADCPRCGDPLELPYAQRRHARMRPLAKVLLGSTVVASVVMLPASLWLVGVLVIALTAWANLRLEERGLLYALLYLFAAGSILLLARWVWGRALLLPRRATAECKACGWSGDCLVREMWD